MHIFFVVTTVVVVVFGVLGCVALFYLIRLFRTLDRIASQVQEEAEEIRADLDDMRKKTKREGLRLVHLITFFGKTAKRAKKKVHASLD
jgi:predicted MFS family arabinose efflux permease